jgi:hypothetical protein
VEIDPQLARQAVDEALRKYPECAPFGARLVWRPLFQGGAFMLEYDSAPPRDLPNLWEFQNAAVRAYQRLLQR